MDWQEYYTHCLICVAYILSISNIRVKYIRPTGTSRVRLWGPPGPLFNVYR
jgi:hypothetical protein